VSDLAEGAVANPPRAVQRNSEGSDLPAEIEASIVSSKEIGFR